MTDSSPNTVESSEKLRKSTHKTSPRTVSAPKTTTSSKTTTTEETIDYAPTEESIDYSMNEVPHNYGPFPEFIDDSDDDPPQL